MTPVRYCRCGRMLPAGGRGRPAVYCSRACRSRAYRERVAGAAVGEPGGVETSGGTQPEGLSRARIVEEAIALADTAGAGGLTMRMVATRLGVGTMSLYRYVSGREELIDLMTDAAFAERPLPAIDERAEWRGLLEFSARQELEIYRRHPWAPQLASLTTRPPIGPSMMAYPDWRLRVLAPVGLEFGEMAQVTILLSSFVQSVALSFAQEAPGKVRQSRRDWLAARRPAIDASLNAADLPMVSRFDEQTFRATEPDAVFEFGLQRLLDGVAVFAADSRPPAKD